MIEFDKMIEIVCNSGERDKAIKEAGNIIYLYQNGTHYKAAAALYDAGWRQQTVAEWKKLTYIHTSDYVIKCSACEASFERKSYQDPFPYCPNCGAKMVGRK